MAKSSNLVTLTSEATPEEIQNAMGELDQQELQVNEAAEAAVSEAEAARDRINRQRAALVALLGEAPPKRRGRKPGRKGAKATKKAKKKAKSSNGESTRVTTKDYIVNFLQDNDQSTASDIHAGIKKAGWTCRTKKEDVEAAEMANVRQAIQQLITDGTVAAYTNPDDQRSSLYGLV